MFNVAPFAREPEKHVLDLIGDGHRFSEKITRQRIVAGFLHGS
jgi:hypothetical protein